MITGRGTEPDLVGRVTAHWAALAAAGSIAPPGWCGVVVVGDRTITAAPDPRVRAVLDAALASLALDRRTDPESPADVLDVADVLGPARLAYLARPVVVPAESAAVPGTPAEIAGLSAAVSDDEAGESGLSEVHHGLSVVRRGGIVVAAAGYEVWPHDVAHLSVLTHPAHRGRGLARDAAARAVGQALAAGLLPQWRARPAASRRVASALGFTDLGAQLSLRLRSPTVIEDS